MSHRLQVLIPKGLDARVAKAAQRRRLSKGEWVRRAIERALAERDQVQDDLERLGALSAPTADLPDMLAEIEAGRR